MEAKTPNLCATLTPWTKDDTLDEAALRRHMRFLVKRNLGLALGPYGTGEGILLEPHERRRLYEIGVEELKGKVPFYAVALGYASTKRIIRDAQEAVSIGVDGAQLYPPRPGQAATPVPLPMLDRFYRDIAEGVKGPLVLGLQSETMPDRTFPIETIGKWLADYPHIVGINCTPRDEAELVKVAKAFGSKIPVRCAGLGSIFANMDNGGVGYLGAEPNVAPTLVNQVVTEYRAGNLASAKELVAKVQKIGSGIRPFGLPGEKAAMHALGRYQPYMRRPFLPLGQQEISQIEAHLKEQGILDTEYGDG